MEMGAPLYLLHNLYPCSMPAVIYGVNVRSPETSILEAEMKPN